jgi:hypothetical protein
MKKIKITMLKLEKIKSSNKKILFLLIIWGGGSM